MQEMWTSHLWELNTMSLYTDLNQILDNQRNRELASHDVYMVNAGPIDIKTFLKSQAEKGRTLAMIHVEKGSNPRHRNSGFATLSGQLAISNAEPSRGIIARNDVGWFYFDMPSTSTSQFHAEVTDLLTYLTNEGLTITSNTIGEQMADIVVDWE